MDNSNVVDPNEPARHTYVFFFFNDTATTEIYTLSLHDALPISWRSFSTRGNAASGARGRCSLTSRPAWCPTDRKSTRLNSRHSQISYAGFCLKKKKDNVERIYNRWLNPSLQPSNSLQEIEA